MLRGFHYWYRRFILRRAHIPTPLWRACVQQLRILHTLNAKELRQLRELTSKFLFAKAISGGNELNLSDEIKVSIAAQASLLIFGLSFDYYDDWYEVIVYPDTFVVSRDETDEYGIVHKTRSVLEGEAWGRGPVVLSWADSQRDAVENANGSNVVLHEFAHKLDMRNGVANGMPPLHADMDRTNWTKALTLAYEDFVSRTERGIDTTIDTYAAKDPAEFFAVLSEVFFVNPTLLNTQYPDVYQQLVQFYRQDPLARLRASST